jgi:hypothetical protein
MSEFDWFDSKKGQWVYVPSQNEDSKKIGGCLFLGILIIGLIVYTIIFAILLTPCWLAILGIMKRKYQLQLAIASLVTGLYYWADLFLGGFVSIMYNGAPNATETNDNIVGGPFPAIIGILNIIGILISLISLYEINKKYFKHAIWTYIILGLVIYLLTTINYKGVIANDYSNSYIQDNAGSQNISNESDVKYINDEHLYTQAESPNANMNENEHHNNSYPSDLTSIENESEKQLKDTIRFYDSVENEGKIEDDYSPSISDIDYSFYPMIVNADKAYFYDDQDENAKRKAYCIKGDEIAVKEFDDQWIQVNFTKNSITSSGWMRRSDLKAKYEVIQTDPGFIISNHDDLPVQIQPDPNKDRLYTMKNGEVASYLGIKTQFVTNASTGNMSYKEPWYYIILDNGTKGWVNGCCIVLTIEPKLHGN